MRRWSMRVFSPLFPLSVLTGISSVFYIGLPYRHLSFCILYICNLKTVVSHKIWLESKADWTKTLLGEGLMEGSVGKISIVPPPEESAFSTSLSSLHGICQQVFILYIIVSVVKIKYCKWNIVVFFVLLFTQGSTCTQFLIL